jgi:hypothetical protein
MFVLAGAAAVWWERRQRGAVTLLTISALWFLWESLWIRPHYLAYFNLFAGGPAHGYRHLVDSSLDWGQDLPGLKQWLDRRGLANQDQMPVYLSYFGTGDPNYYGIRANWLPGYPDLWSQQTLLPLRGGVYCISATMLQQVYTSSAGRWTTAHEQLYQQIATNIGFYDRARQDQAALDDLQQRYGLAFWNQQFEMFLLLRAGRLCAYLRQREPLDLVGYSILIYRLTDEEIDRALFGPPAELLADNPRLHVSSPASTSQPPRPAAPRQP